MPNRIIKESINESRGLAACSFFAQDLFKRLITYADDYGRFNADPQIMVARLYPRELSTVSLEELTDGLIELAGAKKIGFYTSKTRNEVYGAFPNWQDHQRVRDSKKNCPEPDDTSVNDWYLRRFIPIEMKIAIIERDKFKCQICNKRIAEIDNARTLVKMGTGLFHFDHIVPCCQGGRATLENLRLTCASCNQSRKRIFSFEEILEFAENGKEIPEDSETCGNLRKVAENSCEILPESNPIQSESNPNPNPNPKTDAIASMFTRFWDAYPRHEAKQTALKAFQKINPDENLLETMLSAIARFKETAQWQEDGGQYVPHPATWLNQRRWEDEPPKGRVQKKRKDDYDQRPNTEPDFNSVPQWLQDMRAKKQA